MPNVTKAYATELYRVVQPQTVLFYPNRTTD